MKALVAASLTAAALLAPLAPAQSKPDKNAHSIALYVDDFGPDPAAAAVREKIIAAILGRANVKIVSSKKELALILAGSVSTTPGTGLVRLGVHLEDLSGNIAWAFDESKCGGPLTRPAPGTTMWVNLQLYGDPGLYSCVAKQLAKAIGKK